MKRPYITDTLVAQVIAEAYGVDIDHESDGVEYRTAYVESAVRIVEVVDEAFTAWILAAMTPTRRDNDGDDVLERVREVLADHGK